MRSATDQYAQHQTWRAASDMYKKPRTNWYEEQTAGTAQAGASHPTSNPGTCSADDNSSPTFHTRTTAREREFR